ncbi:MAG: 16S rRNA (cytosine(967)-C(5))-methyltransferase RsmB [Actinomycetota bacterium]|nr:16S rRNA (cytosine(967)-C(5))-methyltransferase RsmB [Actinomycetota bacterium]
MAEIALARVCAFAVVRRVFESGAFADRALHTEAAGLDPRDRALAMALAYGTVQRRATLDHIAAALTSRPPAELDPPVLAALRLGLFQLLFLGGIADHAAVNDSVELCKRAGGGGAALVNAVLRRAIREGRALLQALGEATSADAAILHSVPEFVAELWWEQLGSERARTLLRAINQPPESAIRANTLLGTRTEVLERLPVAGLEAVALPEGILVPGGFDAHASELFREGKIMPQSRASMLVARVLAPRPGDRVLDLCAAPGAKTTHLAALMGGQGSLDAVEVNPRRADGLERTCGRMGAGFVKVRRADATDLHGLAPTRDASAVTGRGGYDRVLVDPPCSGLGTLQSRPDLRWRVTPQRLVDVAELQARILAAGAAATAPGGSLVYSVCTISAEEGERLVARFLEANPEWHAEDLRERYPQWSHPGDPRHLQLLPDRDGTDGFFIARLSRA